MQFLTQYPMYNEILYRSLITFELLWVVKFYLFLIEIYNPIINESSNIITS